MKQYLLLADDDIDDCIFFKEALEDIEANVENWNKGVEKIKGYKAE